MYTSKIFFPQHSRFPIYLKDMKLFVSKTFSFYLNPSAAEIWSTNWVRNDPEMKKMNADVMYQVG